MLKNAVLSFRLLWRESRSGEWTIIFLSLIMAVAAITAFHFFTDRLHRGLEQKSAQFLGGDLVISSPYPPPSLWETRAHELQLKTATVLSFPSVVSHGEKLQLVNLQAVSQTYPVIGPPMQNPQRGTVWIEPRLASLLQIQRNDDITIGDMKFQVTQFLNSETDALNTGWIIAPRIMISLEDIPATHTVLPGSRVEYRLLLAGNQEEIKKFRQWISPQLSSVQRLIDIHQQQFALNDMLEKIENYFQLVLLICLMMSGVAIGLSVNQYLKNHYNAVALWRCLGARNQDILQILFWQLTLIAIAAGIVGIISGYYAQQLFAYALPAILKIQLPSSGFKPIALGFIVSITLLFIFAYPLLSLLPKTPPLFLWRREIFHRFNHQNYFFLIYIIILFFLYWFTNFSLMSLFYINMVILSIGILYVISIVLLRILNRMIPYTKGFIKRGLSQLIHYPESISLQFISLTLITMSLFILGNVRKDLLAHWQQSLPKDTPNYFAFNIVREDITPLKKLFQQQNVKIAAFYPMVKGRIILLNGKPILDVVPPSGRSHNALHRELNLSWMWDFPNDNHIVAGFSWTKEASGKAIISVEKNLADHLHLKLNDQLTFQIEDKMVKATIVNFRQVTWSSFHPNFFIIFPPGLLDNFVTTFITSYYLPPQNINFSNLIIKYFPNITIIDIASLLQQIQDLLEKIILAAQYLFIFITGLGILIFVVTLQIGLSERRETYSLLRLLGASQNYIRNSIAVEFIVLGTIIIIMSFTLAKIGTYLMEKNIFNI